MSLPSDQQEDSEKITVKKSTFNAMIVGAVIAIAAATFFVGFLAGSSSSEINSDFVTKSDMENMIKSLEQKLDVAPTPTPTAQPTQPSAPSILQVSLDDDPLKGDPDAPITIVEFSDFQCPFCGRWYTNTLSELEENYIDTGKANLVYRDMPLNSIHPNANPAHIAAECANEQDKFWNYHDILFDRQSEWNRLSSDNLSEQLIEYAIMLDLDSSSFESCLSSPAMASEVSADGRDARQYGATGTPTFFVGNEEIGFEKLVGAQPYSSFRDLIDNQLEQ